MEVTVQDPNTGVTFQTNPARDVAYFGPQILEGVLTRLHSPRLDILDRLREANLNPKDLREAFQALARFHQLASSLEHKTPADAIAASGLLDCPIVAKQIALEEYAKAMLGAVWAGLRSSSFAGECPPVVANLLKTASATQGAI